MVKKGQRRNGGGAAELGCVGAEMLTACVRRLSGQDGAGQEGKGGGSVLAWRLALPCPQGEFQAAEDPALDPGLLGRKRRSRMSQWKHGSTGYAVFNSL